MSRNARRGVDPVTSSPGRDLPAFENVDDLLGGMGNNEDEEEGEGENLFGDDIERDYRLMPQLDTFDPDLLYEDEYEVLSEGERQAAEASMRKRDREEGRGEGRMRRGLHYDDDVDDPRARKGRMADVAAIEDEPMEEEGQAEALLAMEVEERNKKAVYQTGDTDQDMEPQRPKRRGTKRLELPTELRPCSCGKEFSRIQGLM